MEVESRCAFRANSLLWQPRHNVWAITVICKATYRLGTPEAEILDAQIAEPIQEDDEYYDHDGSLRSASDLVPFKQECDVLLTGLAYPPPGPPVLSFLIRLKVAGIDKRIAVWGRRRLSPSGEVAEAPAERVLLTYENAARGKGNPVGRTHEDRDEEGRVRLPRLTRPEGESRGLGPVGFGPIAPTWEARARFAPAHVQRWGAADWHEAVLPDGVRQPFFNVAPADQRVDSLVPDEVIALQHLHPEHPTIVSRLPGHFPIARIEQGGEKRVLPMRADTLCIDSERGLCTLTWRGLQQVKDSQAAGRVVIEMDRMEARSLREIAAANRSRQSRRAPKSEPPPSEPDSTDEWLSSDALIPLSMTHEDNPAITLVLPVPSPFAVPPPPPPRPSSPGPAPTPATPPPLPRPSSPGPAPSPQMAGPAPNPRTPGTVLAPSAVPPVPPPRASAPGPAPGSPALPPAVPSSPGSPPPLPALGPTPSPGAGRTTPAADQPDDAVLGTMLLLPGGAPAHMWPFQEQQAKAVATAPRVPPSTPVSSPAADPTPVSPPMLGAPPPPARVERPSIPAENPRGTIGERIRQGLAPTPGEPPPKEPPQTNAGAGAGSSSQAVDGTEPRLGSLESLRKPRSLSAQRASDDAALKASPARPSSEGSAKIVLPPNIGIDLLWFDPASLPRIRREPDWKDLVRALRPRPRDLDFGEGPSSEERQNAKDRREIVGVLAGGRLEPPYGLLAALRRGIEEDGSFTPPLVLLSGSLNLLFDEVEALNTTIDATSPYVLPEDHRLRQKLEAGREALRSPWIQRAGAFADRLRKDIEDAFGDGKRAISVKELRGSVHQLLLEGRHYQKTSPLGQPWIRTTWRQPGEAAVPAYLPVGPAGELPIFESLPARIIAEVRPRMELSETPEIALRIVALGRTLSLT